MAIGQVAAAAGTYATPAAAFVKFLLLFYNINVAAAFWPTCCCCCSCLMITLGKLLLLAYKQ